jgi:hypothetical protein
MLFRGFLVLPAEINSTRFVFKSINQREFELIQLVSGSYSGINGRSLERYYNTFLAYGVFMVDGVNILPNRDQYIPLLQETFSKMAPTARGKIIQYLSELNHKATGSVTLTEAYQIEAASRFKWVQYKGLDMMIPSSTGIDGTEKLGINFAQLVWRALNQYEDLKETAEREWDNAKFIGSCFAGKSVQKIYAQDRDRRSKEREERLNRRDQLIRRVILRESPEEVEKSGNYVMIVAKTADELAAQLERDLRGEKDWHDQVVAREEARLRGQIRDRQAKILEMNRERDKVQSGPYTVTTKLEGLTKEEVQQRIQRSLQVQNQESASRMVYPEMEDERMPSFFEKYVDQLESTYPVDSVGTTDRDPSEVLVHPPLRPKSVPFRR